MPNCFKLINRQTGDPEKLIDIDDQIRDFVGAEHDETNFYLGWYDIVGLELALGHDWKQIMEKHQDDDEMMDVINWMATRYDPVAWVQR